MKILFPLLLLVSLALAGIPKVLASETRVDSTGGLSLVMDDESVAINPYIYSNPAGLGLLPVQNRFDYTEEWLRETAASTNEIIHLYGTYNDVGNSKFYYQGLTVWPTDRWAVQADADLFNNDNGNFTYDLPPLTNDRTREYVRTTYNFGPFVLGASLIPVQLNQTFNSYSTNPSSLFETTSGTGTYNSLTGTGGLLVCFPGDPGPKQSRLELGGTFGSQLGMNQQKNDFGLEYNSVTPINLTDTYLTTTDITWQPQIFYEIPGSFQGALLGQFNRTNVTTQVVSTDTTLIKSTATYNSDNTTYSIGVATFKMTNSLSPSLNFKTGGYFSLESATDDTFKSNGNPSNDGTINTWVGQMGVGVESPGSFTVGLQAQITSANGQSVTNGLSPVNYLSYQFTVGGERWLSQDWAFRMGIVFENDLNTGDQDYATLYYPVGPDQRITATTLTAGVGYQDSHLKTDFMFWTGQPSIYGSPNTDDFATQIGLQLALGIIF
ncbi:MAG TPA: hypothetical protein VK859_08060 [bacterium]|jgi:hypothetical protein|nr:hypothetical protein [bacterium]